MQDRARPARLVIVGDSALVREGMRAVLAREPDLEVVAEATNGAEALHRCRSSRPDLVLMDVGLPETEGLAATREIKAECPTTAVLILTSSESPDYLTDAIEAGAAGYVSKGTTETQLTSAIRLALGGESPSNQELVMQPPSGYEPQSMLLTPRELDVVHHLTEGKTNRQIAHDLHLSLSTVKSHLERIISKLEASDRTQAAVRAVELGLVDPIPKEERRSLASQGEGPS